MNELITAAKAVIEDLGFLSDASIDGLRAAVERAEKQEDVGFEEWLSTHNYAYPADQWVEFGRHAWTAAQQAERERIKSLIADIGTSGRNECWDCCETILEKIDE